MSRCGDRVSREPILRRMQARPGLAGALSVAMFAGITVLRWFLEGSGQAVVLLYLAPIALVAVSVGRRSAYALAGASVICFGIFALVHSRGDRDLTGFVDPVFAVGVIGALLGFLAERGHEEARRAEAEGRQRVAFEELCRRQHAALEHSDVLIQALNATRWLIERGENERALEVLADLMEQRLATFAEVLHHADVALREAERRVAGGPEPGADALD